MMWILYLSPATRVKWYALIFQKCKGLTVFTGNPLICIEDEETYLFMLSIGIIRCSYGVSFHMIHGPPSRHSVG